MGIFSGLFKSRDKPTNSYDSPSYTYFFGRANSGKRVTDRTAMQHIAVYACVRVLSEAIAQLPLHVYQYTENGKERVPQHPLYFLLHDQPNPEMTSFVFRCSLPRKTQKTDTQNEKNAPEHHVQERFLLPINGVLPLFYPFNFSSILATCRKICLSVSLLLVSFSVSSFGLSVVVVAFFANPFSPAALMIAG